MEKAFSVEEILTESESVKNYMLGKSLANCEQVRLAHAKLNELNNDQELALNDALNDCYLKGFSEGLELGTMAGISASSSSTAKMVKAAMAARSVVASLVGMLVLATIIKFTQSPLLVFLLVPLATCLLLLAFDWAFDLVQNKFLTRKAESHE